MKGFMKTLASAICALCGAVAICAAAEAPDAVSPANVAVNGGFEEWGEAPGKPQDGAASPQTPDGMPSAWLPCSTTGVIARDATVKHGGAHAVRIENTDVKAAVGVVQCVDVEPDTRYRINVWLKGENVSATGGAMILVIGSSDANKADRNIWTGACSDVYKQPSPCNGTFEWKMFAFTVDMPAKAKALRMLLELRGASGTLWFDDVEVLRREKIQHVESY